jgi:hypothetical protein
MMDAAELRSHLRAARESLSAVEAAVQKPTPVLWEDAAPRLQHAAGLLGAAERALAGMPAIPLDLRAEIRADVQALARDIRRVDALMRAAAEFYTGWAQLLGAVLGGYSPSGEVLPLSPSARLSLRG